MRSKFFSQWHYEKNGIQICKNLFSFCFPFWGLLWVLVSLDKMFLMKLRSEDRMLYHTGKNVETNNFHWKCLFPGHLHPAWMFLCRSSVFSSSSKKTRLVIATGWYWVIVPGWSAGEGKLNYKTPSFEVKSIFILKSVSMRWEQISSEWNKDFLGCQDLSYQSEEVGFLLATGSFNNPFARGSVKTACRTKTRSSGCIEFLFAPFFFHSLLETLPGPTFKYFQANVCVRRESQKSFV